MRSIVPLALPRRSLALGVGLVLAAFVATWLASRGRPAEPATFVTDYLLAVLGVAFGLRVHAAASRPGGRSEWGLALIAIGAAAALGGSCHALGLAESSSYAWLLTLAAVGAAAFLLAAATVQAFLPEGALARWTLRLLSLKLLVYLLWVQWHRDFRWAVLDYGATLLALLVAAGLLWIRRREASAPWLAAAILVSFAAAAIQQLELSPHPRFNHNDLYHLVQAGGLWLFYRAGRLLPEAGPRTTP